MNATNAFVCTCGNNSGHQTFAECDANRGATAIYMKSLNAARFDGTSLRADHHNHFTPCRLCPDCPLDARFVRDSAEGEWYVPQTV